MTFKPKQLSLLRPLLLIMAVISAAAHADTLYRWTDANGVVHFSDRPAPASAKVKKAPIIVEIKPSNAPYNNVAEERWHGALREHQVQIRTITITTPAPTHSNPTGKN